MHELPHNPPDYGSSERTSFFPCRPTVKHRSHSLQRKAWLGRVASFAATNRVRCCGGRTIRVSLLFPRSSSLACAHRPHRNQLPSETTAYVAAVTPLLDNEQVSMPQLTADVHFLGGRFPAC
mgnify:CR=1 FL=1